MILSFIIINHLLTTVKEGFQCVSTEEAAQFHQNKSKDEASKSPPKAKLPSRKKPVITVEEELEAELKELDLKEKKEDKKEDKKDEKKV